MSRASGCVLSDQLHSERMRVACVRVCAGGWPGVVQMGKGAGCLPVQHGRPCVFKAPLKTGFYS